MKEQSFTGGICFVSRTDYEYSDKKPEWALLENTVHKKDSVEWCSYASDNRNMFEEDFASCTNFICL